MSCPQLGHACWNANPWSLTWKFKYFPAKRHVLTKCQVLKEVSAKPRRQAPISPMWIIYAAHCSWHWILFLYFNSLSNLYSQGLCSWSFQHRMTILLVNIFLTNYFSFFRILVQYFSVYFFLHLIFVMYDFLLLLFFTKTCSKIGVYTSHILLVT